MLRRHKWKAEIETAVDKVKLGVIPERKRTNTDIAYGDCLVIGDTPYDVACAKPFGAVTIAVATGPYSYETLLKTGADHVLKDLTKALDIIRMPRL